MSIIALAALAVVLAPMAAALAPAETEKWIVGVFGMPDVQPGDSYHLGTVHALDHDLMYVLVETSNPVGLQASARLDENVRYVEFDDPHWAHLLYVPNDPLWTNSGHYGPKIIGATVAWDKTRGSTSV